MSGSFLMQLTQRSIRNFKRLYLQEFGEELSDAEAKRKAESLVGVYRAAYGLLNIDELFDKKIEDEKEGE